MTHKSTSTALSKKLDKSLSGWDALISAAKQRIRDLNQSIRLWQELRDAGEPCPGTAKSPASDSQPSGG